MHQGREDQSRDGDQQVIAQHFSCGGGDAVRIANGKAESQRGQERQRAHHGQRQKNPLHERDPARAPARSLKPAPLVVIVVTRDPPDKHAEIVERSLHQ